VAAQQPPQVSWTGEAEPWPYAASQRIDLTNEPGLRIFVQQMESRSRLLFDFHHACSDGVGGLGFVEDVFSLYARLVGKGGGSPKELPVVDVKQLHQRSRFEIASCGMFRNLMLRISELYESARFLAGRPAPLAVPDQPSLRLIPRPHPQRMWIQRLDSTSLGSLRSRAAAKGSTLNDLLVRALFQSVSVWNCSHVGHDRNDVVRVLIPTNIRGREDLEMPAANRTSYAFLQRRSADMHDHNRLLASITEEMSELRRRQFPIRTMTVLSWIHAIPMAWKSFLPRHRCMATAAISNVGDPTRRFRARFPRDRQRIVVGDVRLESFSAISPNRPLTRAVFLVNSYAGELTIALRLDPTCFLSCHAASFLQMFVEHLSAADAGHQFLRRAA
jgi:hypothetical protein